MRGGFRSKAGPCVGKEEGTPMQGACSQAEFPSDCFVFSVPGQEVQTEHVWDRVEASPSAGTGGVVGVSVAHSMLRREGEHSPGPLRTRTLGLLYSA